MTANLNVLNSKINVRSDTYKTNQSAMLPLVQDLPKPIRQTCARR